jgi:hypothetical protein
LRNHIGEIVAVDFFTVPTIWMRVLFVFLIVEHQRRKIIHFGITEHPTAEWAAQQVVEAFAKRAHGGSVVDRPTMRLLRKLLLGGARLTVLTSMIGRS